MAARGEAPNVARLIDMGVAFGHGAMASLPTVTLAPGTTVDEAERRLILLTLEHTRNNKTRAAEILGISLKTLHNKLNRMKQEAGRV